MSVLIQITGPQGANLRSTPDVSTQNIIKVYPTGEILNADQAAQPDWWAVLTLPPGYIHHSVASLYTPPPPAVPLDYVPYISQWSRYASSQADCGPTCCAMFAQWKGINKNPNDFKIRSDAAGHTTADELVQNLETVGLTARVQYVPPGEWPELPAICLVAYSGFMRSSVQDVGFTGLHWLILLEHDDNFVTVHDPDWWSPCESCGNKKQYTIAEWKRAFIPYTAAVMREAVVLVR